MKKIFIVSFMFLFAFVVSAQNRGGRGFSEADMEKRYEGMTKELHLNTQQLDSVKAIDKEFFAEVHKARESSGSNREAWRVLGEKRNERIKAVLTDEQYAGYQKMEEKRRASGGRRN